MSDDTIKRSDAIEAVSISCRTCLARDIEDCKKCSVPKLRELINAIPSADRPQGKWLLSDLQSQTDNDNGNYAYVCTNCNHTDIHAKTQKVPYCWWCGAQMKGANDDD